MQKMSLIRRAVAMTALAFVVTPNPAHAWWEKGHRLVAGVAMSHLTPTARRNVKALLGTESLADVASWADEYRPLETQTGGWHYTDLPPASDVYDRERDCPVQPGVKAGARNDKWRDCATDRILFFEDRLRDPLLDPVDHALALKYLVHFVGDIHQPMHATGVEKGGNGIVVTAFGSPMCGTGKCNLHAVWDGYLIDHTELTEAQYLSRLEHEIKAKKLAAGTTDPATWTNESKTASDAAMLPNGSDIGDAYYQRSIPVIDQRLEMAGLRLAAVLNEVFTTAPARFHPKQTTAEKQPAKPS